MALDMYVNVCGYPHTHVSYLLLDQASQHGFDIKRTLQTRIFGFCRWTTPKVMGPIGRSDNSHDLVDNGPLRDDVCLLPKAQCLNGYVHTHMHACANTCANR